MTRVHLSIVLLVSVLLPASAGRGGASSLCSLDWADVVQSFGPQSGWSPTGPPIPLMLDGGERPDYQAQMFATAAGDRAALVVAEWGEPGSPDLGPIVYCAVRGADGRVLEEVGRHPLGGASGDGSCQSDDDGHCA